MTDENTVDMEEPSSMAILDQLLNQKDPQPLSVYIQEIIDALQTGAYGDYHSPEAECAILTRIAESAKQIETACAELSTPMVAAGVNAGLRMLLEHITKAQNSIFHVTRDITGCSIDDPRCHVLIQHLADLGMACGELLAEKATVVMDDFYLDVRQNMRAMHNKSAADYQKILDEHNGDAVAARKHVISRAMQSLAAKMEDLRKSKADVTATPGRLADAPDNDDE